MANIEVDFLIFPTVRRLGAEWNWSIKALSPAQGAAQVWGGDGSSVEADAAKAAYGACDGLAKEFACEQGVERACSVEMREAEAGRRWTIKSTQARRSSPLEFASLGTYTRQQRTH